MTHSLAYKCTCVYSCWEKYLSWKTQFTRFTHSSRIHENGFRYIIFVSSCSSTISNVGLNFALKLDKIIVRNHFKYCWIFDSKYCPPTKLYMIEIAFRGLSFQHKCVVSITHAVIKSLEPKEGMAYSTILAWTCVLHQSNFLRNLCADQLSDEVRKCADGYYSFRFRLRQQYIAVWYPCLFEGS